MTYRVSFAHVKLVTWGLWRPGGPTRHWAPTGTSCWSQKLWKHFVKVSKRSLWSYLKFPPHCSLHFGLKKVVKAAKAAFYFFGQMVPFDLWVNPWWSLTVSGPPRTLQRSPKVTRPLRLFKLKTLQYGCLWIPFDLRVDAWCKLKVSEPLKVPRALCLFRLKPWKNGENWLSWPSKASGKNLKRSRRCSIGLFNVNFWPHP